MTNVYGNNRDVLTLDDELNQSFYETENENEEFNFTEQSSNRRQKSQLNGGKLDTENIVKNLSNLGRNADGTKHVYLKLTIPGFELRDITEIAKYKDIQNLDLSFNQLKDLSPLSELRYLLNLNVSNNKLEKLFDFLPPNNLKEANFAFNEISEIGQLTDYHYLQTLILNHNKIEKIEGLEYCHRLKHLDLGHNIIRKIEGLDKLPIVNLDLRSNMIKRVERIENLNFLRFLNLSSNMIRSIQGIPEKHEFLESIDLEDNKISDLFEIENLLNLQLLREINFLQNPIREVTDYRLSIVFKLPKITHLDRRKVDPSEKVNANSLFNPSIEYIASRDHMTNLVFSFIQDHRVKESTLPSVESPYPILILCGPEGCGRVEISKKLVDDYPDYFDFVVSHTTREPRLNERNKIDYNFIKLEQFELDVTHGKFICCNEYVGNWYGVQSDAIETISRQGLACVVQAELEGLLSFKQTYYEPRCILLITLDKKAQVQRLINDDCTDDECEIALNRVEWYSEYNKQHPGFFDAVIVTDDLNEGYENLRNLVMTYLGLNQDQKNESARPKTSEEIRRLEETFSKDLELPRTDSFLPSNTVTANRSQQSSHQSIESLSQIYNQNLRFKFGSAPAQLTTKGFVAEKSLEKRSFSIKKEIEDSNNVSVKSQISQHISKAAERGTESPALSTRQGGLKSKSADGFNGTFNGTETMTKSPKSFPKSKDTDKNDDELNSSEDDEAMGNKRDDHLSVSARSKNSSQNSMRHENKNQKASVKLPLLDLRSTPGDSMGKNNGSTVFDKKKSTVVLPSIA